MWRPYLEHLAHHVDIGNIGHVLQRRLARRQKRCRHEFERGVLGAETGTEPPMAWPPSTRIISKVYPFKKHARDGWAIPGMMCSQMVER